MEVLSGDVPDSVTVREGGIEYDVDLRRGQKTGLFLDQRENREAAARYAHGRLLDCFTYNGGFALEAGGELHGDDRVRHLGRGDCAGRARTPARNGLTIDARVGNVFDELRGLERLRERFDTIVLDPPAFAKTKAAVPKAAAGYKEINLRALKLLNPGGTLVTCSCSYNVSEAAFAEIIYDAAVDAQTHVTVVEKRMQGRDHPGAARRAGDLLPEMLHPAKGRVRAVGRPFQGRRTTPAQAAREARRALARLARPAGAFDASRYFRDTAGLRFYNIGADRVRAHGARDRAGQSGRTGRLTMRCAFADLLVDRSAPRSEGTRDRGAGPLPSSIHAGAAVRAGNAGWRTNHSANWATTDAICGLLIGPLVAGRPQLAAECRPMVRPIATCGSGAPRSSA